MARPFKQGLDYFPLDVDLDNDDKLGMIIAEYGYKGEQLYIKLLSWIYNHEGYFMLLEEETQLKFLHRFNYCGFTLDFLQQAVPRMVRWNLFDKAIYERFNALTSERIQETWIDASRKRKERFYVPDLWLIKVIDGIKAEEIQLKAEETTINGVNCTQRKEKKRKVNNEANASCQNAPPFDAREQFSKLEITKPVLWAFIKEVQPNFIEPYVSLWNIFADEKKLPQVSKLNDTRKKKFAKRIGEKSFSFLKILNKAAKSDMILKANWFTFDWILESEANYLKVLEGNYDNKDAAKAVAAETVQLKKLSKTERDINFNYERFLEGNLDVVNMYDNDYDFLLQRGITFTEGQQLAAEEDAVQYMSVKKIEVTGENIASLGKRFCVIQHFKLLKHKGNETIFKP